MFSTNQVLGKPKVMFLKHCALESPREQIIIAQVCEPENTFPTSSKVPLITTLSTKAKCHGPKNDGKNQHLGTSKGQG